MNKPICDICHELETAWNLVTETASVMTLESIQSDNSGPFGLENKEREAVEIRLRLPSAFAYKHVCSGCLAAYIVSKTSTILATLIPYQSCLAGNSVQRVHLTAAPEKKLDDKAQKLLKLEKEMRLLLAE